MHSAAGKPLADTKGALHYVFILILLLQAQTYRTVQLHRRDNSFLSNYNNVCIDRKGRKREFKYPFTATCFIVAVGHMGKIFYHSVHVILYNRDVS